MTAPNPRAQFPAPRPRIVAVEPARNPEADWIAEMNGEIDCERARLGLRPRADKHQDRRKDAR